MNQDPVVVDQRLHLLRRHWQGHPAPAHGSPQRSSVVGNFSVAISREAGAPGMEVARAMGERLHWPVYDREVIDLIAQQSGLRSELLESVDEHDRNWLIEALESFKRRDRVSSAEFVHHLVHVLTALAAHGSCIIVGRGAAACLPRATTLRLRVVADLGDRVNRAASELRTSNEAAQNFVQRVDRERAQFAANHFHRDINDAHNFDIVVNASRLSVQDCAEVGLQALHGLRIAAAGTKTAPHAESAPVV
jgi:cytidylate kinase